MGEAGYESRSRELLLRRPHAARARSLTTIAAGGIVYRERVLSVPYERLRPARGRHALRRRGRRRAGSVTGEVVFTTGMSGYQESMTDPSFARQLITFTTAHVGNYGVSEAAMESDRIHAARRDHARRGRLRRRARRRAGLAELAARPTASRASRASTRARSSATSAPRARCAAGSSPPTCRRARRRERIARRAEHGRPRPRPRGDDRREPRIYAGEGDGPRIVALDTGIKRSIIRNFTVARRDARDLPVHDAPPRSCWPRDPDGFFLVPGPGDPAALDYIVENIRTLLTHQAGVRHLPRPPAAVARRRAWRRSSCPFGHRGANHPVKDLRDRPDRDHLARTTASRSRASPARSSSPSSAPPSSPT